MAGHVSLMVDSKELRACLRRMGRGVGKVCGAGLWEFSGTVLTIEWSGCVETLAGIGHGSDRVAVDGAHMRGLSRVPLSPGNAALRLEDGRLYLGTMSVPCAPVTVAVSCVIPAFADQRELLLASHRHTRAELEAAGHASELERARDRLHASVGRAAKALAWLGIDGYDLDDWVDRQLRNTALGGRDETPRPPVAPKPRLVVVDRTDQIALFHGREGDPQS